MRLVSAKSRQRMDGIRKELRLAREAEGLSLRELAREAGISSRSLPDWERGPESPHLLRAVRWAGFFGFRLQVVDAATEIDVCGDEPGESAFWDESETLRLIAGLRSRREARGLSQEELGRLLGYSTSSIVKREWGGQCPSLVDFIEWAACLKCRTELRRDTAWAARATPRRRLSS